MDYKTNWKDFLQYDEHGRRVHDFPSYVVDTAPGEKNYMYRGEYEAMVAAEKAVKNAARAARQAELAASRPEASESRASGESRRGDPNSPSAARRPGDPPDLERHSRRCLICSHPDRDAIEGEFIRWRSPHKIARDYALSDRATVYRHAHATNLFAERQRHVARVLESFLETIDDNPPADFDPVTRAVRVYAHLNANGAWFEPLRKVHITTSHIHTSNPAPDSDLDPDSEIELEAESRVEARDFSHGSAGLQPTRKSEPPSKNESCLGGRSFSSDIKTGAERRTSVENPPRSDRSDSVSRHSSLATSHCVEGVEARDFSHGEQRFSAAETERCAPAPTFSLAERDCPSRESAEGYPSPVTNNDPQNLASREGEPQLRLRHSAAGEEKALGAVAPNRHNPKINNSPNQHQTNDIPKVNRNKNIDSASPRVR